jgi:hypothetical protein
MGGSISRIIRNSLIGEETRTWRNSMTALEATSENGRQVPAMSTECEHIAELATTSGTDSRPQQGWQTAETLPSATETFEDMLALLGLDTETNPLRGSIWSDLYSTCVNCTRRQDCHQWLTRSTHDNGYRDFCPNAWIFDRYISRNRWCGIKSPIETSSST